MKKTKGYLFVAIVALSLMLSGCGTAMFELTSEEEELIIHYSAYIVSKHNIQQKDGMSGVYMDEDSESTELDEVEEETESESESESTSDDETSGDEQEIAEVVSLAEIIGHAEDLNIVYGGSYLAENYVEGSSYSVDAREGKIFYVMKFKLTNNTSQPVTVDNASVNPIFKLESENISVKSEVTFLLTDFSTYQGTIAAGTSVDTILLFEVSKGDADSIKTPVLSITVDNVKKNVKL